MGKNLTGRANEKHGELLNFYGVVKDNKNLDVEYAIVMLFACYTGGIEKPLECTFTDREGRYFITMPKLPHNNDLLGFKVRASKPHILSKAFDSGLKPIDLAKAGESENYHPSPEGVIWVKPNQLTALDDLPVKSEFISTAIFLVMLSMFGIFAVDVKKNLPGR